MATYEEDCTVTLRPGMVAMVEGDAVFTFMDTLAESNGGPVVVHPIRRAVIVARLRALADVIEKTGEQ